MKNLTFMDKLMMIAWCSVAINEERIFDFYKAVFILYIPEMATIKMYQNQDCHHKLSEKKYKQLHK